MGNWLSGPNVLIVFFIVRRCGQKTSPEVSTKEQSLLELVRNECKKTEILLWTGNRTMYGWTIRNSPKYASACKHVKLTWAKVKPVKPQKVYRQVA